ncbi:MAG: esterase-like activity of phytase family protein, partial [Microcystaceae cyanobacterium]
SQDIDLEKRPRSAPLRFLHYLINPLGEPVLIGENLYVLDAIAPGTLFSGLSDITTLEKEGYFISLERNLGLAGFGIKLFQVVNANATDTSQIKSFRAGTQNIEPLRKKLILDLASLGIELDNLEGLTFGPRLADGSPTLLLVSDDNFREDQVTQFLLFRVKFS